VRSATGDKLPLGLDSVHPCEPDLSLTLTRRGEFIPIIRSKFLLLTIAFLASS